MQGGKLRLKDDFTAETVDMAEKLRVESVDELAANILATILKAGAQPEWNLLEGHLILKVLPAKEQQQSWGSPRSTQMTM